ncbi:ribonuclease H-like domain-containing protein [Pisolithus microcarpus]|nr:ribonuclease H-like domain-containing protein [Pisolithus microcarpus]
MHWEPGLPPDMGYTPKPAMDTWPLGKMKVLGLHGVEVEPSVAMKKQDGNGTLAAIVVKEGRKKQKETGDYHIMKFIVCCGIPPTVMDSAEWKEVVAALNPHYQPLSSTTLTKKLIVNEAAKITATINKILLGCHNLTITFDGDGCHLLNLAIKDICLLPEFGEIISQIWSILAFMSCSTYSMEHFNHHLEYIGETHFGTIYWSALSVQCGLPAFAALAECNIDIMGHNSLFLPGGWKILFELALSKLLQVTGPWAKGLRVLEAADVTADYIYYIFLGIMSQLEEDFRKNEFSLGQKTIEDIRRIANSQFNELVNETPQSHDLYITAFVCNPAYRHAPVYKDINPLTVPTIIISRAMETGISCSKRPPQDMVECAGLALQRILRHEYGDIYEVGSSVMDPVAAMKAHNPALSKYTPYDALQWLHQQFKSYLNREDPFNRKPQLKQSTLEWWVALESDEFADVLAPLAEKIYAAVPVSMADECMQSTVTWLNLPHRNRQEVTMLQDHIKIQQWHHYSWDKHNSKTLYKPLVTWQDMEATIRGKQLESPTESDLPLPGHRPSPLHPVNPSVSDVNLGSDDVDGISWLNGPYGLAEDFHGTPGERFTLAGCDGIDLRSPWLQDIITSDPRQPQQPNVSFSDSSPTPSFSQVVPSTSAWDEWE